MASMQKIEQVTSKRMYLDAYLLKKAEISLNPPERADSRPSITPHAGLAQLCDKSVSTKSAHTQG
jgi:hypothetical protein